jgi:hypothetical protein
LPIVKVFNKSSTACEFIVCTECTAFEVHKLRVLDAQLLHVTFFRSEKSVSSDVMELLGGYLSTGCDTGRTLSEERLSGGWYLWKLLGGLAELGTLERYRFPPGPFKAALLRALAEVVPELEQSELDYISMLCGPGGAHEDSVRGTCIDVDAKTAITICDWPVIVTDVSTTGPKKYLRLTRRIGCSRPPRAKKRSCCLEHERRLAVPQRCVEEVRRQRRGGGEGEGEEGGAHMPPLSSISGNCYIDKITESRGPLSNREYRVKFIGVGQPEWIPTADLPVDALLVIASEFHILDDERKEIKSCTRSCGTKPKVDQVSDTYFHTAGIFVCLVCIQCVPSVCVQCVLTSVSNFRICCSFVCIWCSHLQGFMPMLLTTDLF